MNSTNVGTKQQGLLFQNDLIVAFSQPSIESHHSEDLHQEEITSHDINQSFPPSSS